MTNKQQVIDFIKYLAGDSKIQISTLNHPIKFTDAEGKENIYFCGGLWAPKASRCDDDDIKSKKYCFVDIDIRNDYFLKTGEVISQEELNKVIMEIIARLELKAYNDYSAVVSSGNGVHIYRTGEERKFDKETYANWIKQLQSIINHILSDMWYVCDPACTNLSRISRLPWTINPRKKERANIKYDLWPIEAEILYFEPKDSETFASLELFATLYKEHDERERKERREVKELVKTTYKKGEDMRAEINSIPVQEIAEYVRGVRATADDGEVITLKEPHKNMGAYVYKPYNIVYNQWSTLIKTKRDTFTPFELVCYEMMDWNRSETVKWFKDKYGIQTDKKPQPIAYEKLYNKIAYRYPGKDMEEEFGCIVSGELVMIAAATNKGKTSFWLNILKANREHKVGLINMEFDIADTFRFQYLRSKGYNDNQLKSVGTSLSPTTDEFEKEIQGYIDKRMNEVNIHNLPQDTELTDLLNKLYELWKEGYSLIMIDSLSSIKWGNSNDWQELIMKHLRNFCTSTGMAIILIHHFNKGGKEYSGNQKIADLCNVVILIHFAEDAHEKQYRAFVMNKDKAHSKPTVFHWYLELEWQYKKVPHWIQDNTTFINSPKN